MRPYRVVARVLLCSSLFLCGLLQSASGVNFFTTTYPAGFGPNSVVAGDFNRDGNMDLVVADACIDFACFGPGAVAVLLGRADGTFRKGKKYVAGAAGEAADVVTAGDFNGDGALDLAVVNTGINLFGDVSVLLGNGDGSFQPPSAYAVGGAVPVWVAVGDFNGDHKLDLAVSVTTTDSVAVLLGKGDGTFGTAINYAVESAPQGFTVADVNRDGKLDLVVANECGADPACRLGTVSILLGNGDGTFQSQLSFMAGIFPLSVAVADFNGDHHPDLVVADPCGTDGTCASNGSVGLLLGNGDGTFQPILYYTATGMDTARVAVLDADGDHHPDVVALNYVSSDITVFLDNPDGTLQPGTDFPVGANPISVAIADFNHDRATDMAVISQIPNTVTIFINNSGTE